MVGGLAYRTLLYQPRLAAPAASLKLLGFAGRALGFVLLSSAYFSIINKTKEESIANSQVVKDLVLFGLCSLRNTILECMILVWQEKRQLWLDFSKCFSGDNDKTIKE